MKEYCINITETLERQVCITAPTVYDALAIAKRGWVNGLHILDSDDFIGVDFAAAETY